MTRNVMSVVALVTLCSSSVAMAQDAPAVEGARTSATDAPTKTEWMPPGSFQLHTTVKKGALKLGEMSFDTTIEFDGRPLGGETSGNAHMRLLTTEVERNSEGQERTIRGRYVISDNVITNALRWLDPEEGSIEKWARRAGIPTGTELEASVSSGSERSPRSRGFLRLAITFDGTKVNQSVFFAGQELSEKEVEQLITFLESAQRELRAFEMRVRDA